jgi:hypothetical protein
MAKEKRKGTKSIKGTKRLGFWVTSKIPFYIVFAALYLAFNWLVHHHVPIYGKSNDLWNDNTFSKPLEGELFPGNIILIDIDSWPYYKDNREQAQTARNKVVTQISGIIDLLNKNPKVSPPFIGIDMTFESFADHSIMKRLLEQVNRQDNIYLSVEFDRETKSLKRHGNFFQDKIKQNIKRIKKRLMVVSLEKYRDEPVRRYRTFYKAGFDESGKTFNFPSMGTVVAKMLHRHYLGDNKTLDVPDGISRLRFRYLIQNVKEDYRKYRVYSPEQVKDWLENSESKIDISKSIVIFGRMDPTPNGRDRVPVCAGTKEQATLPGVMVHLNAAMSILLKENIRKMAGGEILIIFFLLLIFLIPVHIMTGRLFSRCFPGLDQWHPGIFLFIIFVPLIFFAKYLVNILAYHNLEIPMFTFYMFILYFVPALVIVDWFYRHAVLRGLFRYRCRRFMKTFKKSLVRCAVEDNPLLRFKMVVDLFQNIMVHLALYDLARWRHIPGKKKLNAGSIKRTSVTKLRNLIKHLDLSANALFKSNRLDNPEGGAYHILLKARNDFRHRSSSTLKSWQWDRMFDKTFPNLLSFMESLKEELCKKIVRGKGETGNTEIYLDDNGRMLGLFPLFQEFECDYHRKKEIFLYASGLCLKYDDIEMMGENPFCKPLLTSAEENELNESFKHLEEEIKHADG